MGGLLNFPLSSGILAFGRAFIPNFLIEADTLNLLLFVESKPFTPPDANMFVAGRLYCHSKTCLPKRTFMLLNMLYLLNPKYFIGAKADCKSSRFE